MTTRYPSQVDTSLTLPTVVDNVTPINASVINRLRDAILATQGELGPKPAGVYGNLRNRLDSLENLIVAISPGAEVLLNSPVFGGDLVEDGYAIQNVIGFYGRPLENAAPDFEEAYMWDGYQWASTIPFQAGQDISGTRLLQTVIALRNRPLDTTTPADGYAYLWDLASSKWVPKSTFIASGDLTGNRLSQTVVKIHGRNIDSTVPGDGYSYVWNLSSNKWIAKLSDFIPGGDLSGATNSQTVIRIQGRNVDSGVPTEGEAYLWNNSLSKWIAESPFTAGGDLTGTRLSQTVTKIQNRDISALAPSDEELLTWSSSLGQWTPKPAFLLSGDITGTRLSQTVIRIQNKGISTIAPTEGQLLTWSDSLNKWAPRDNAFVAFGDLSGTINSQIVRKIQGRAVSTNVPLNEQILIWNSSANEWIPKFNNYQAGGDLSGTLTHQTVIGLYGRPVSSNTPFNDQALVWSSSTGEWKPKTVTSGGSSVTFSGDLLGSDTTQTVVKINGATVPVSGSLTTGSVLKVSGVSALSYGAINLAGGSNHVTGVLPAVNQANQLLGGDLSGNTSSGSVIKIRGNAVKSGSLSSTQDGYVLTWVNSLSEWEAKPGSGGSGFTAGGDLLGTSTNQTVVGLQTVDVANTVPIASAVPVYSATNVRYDIRKLSLDDIDPAFDILSFSGGSTVEVGATVTNPGFTASYTATPASAQITNTDATDSPKVLTTPFTSGTVTGVFTKSTVTSVTFTLQAVAATTKFANSSISFEARSFYGIAGAGATSATASGNNASLVGTAGTLTNNGLGSFINTSFGPLSPSNQKIYFLCVHTVTPHTFKDQNGFSFAFNAPTVFNFINQNAVSLSYDLYESTNLLSTSFTITIVS